MLSSSKASFRGCVWNAGKLGLLFPYLTQNILVDGNENTAGDIFLSLDGYPSICDAVIRSGAFSLA